MQARQRLILAVDTADINEARRVLDELHDCVGVFKIGLQLFTHYGPEILKVFQSAGAKIFLDCKFLDIPNTVAKACEEATAHGVGMFTVHASGGKDMLKAAAAATEKKASELGVKPPTILAVTVLTSISQATLTDELHVSGKLDEHVLRLARMSFASGVKGIVASPEEAARLRQELGPDLVLVSPGVRPAWSDPDDQSRFTSPYEAIKNGSDYLVVGRPIIKANNRREAAQKILAEIEEALS